MDTIKSILILVYKEIKVIGPLRVFNGNEKVRFLFTSYGFYFAKIAEFRSNKPAALHKDCLVAEYF